LETHVIDGKTEAKSDHCGAAAPKMANKWHIRQSQIKCEKETCRSEDAVTTQW